MTARCHHSLVFSLTAYALAISFKTQTATKLQLIKHRHAVRWHFHILQITLTISCGVIPTAAAGPVFHFYVFAADTLRWPKNMKV